MDASSTRVERRPRALASASFERDRSRRRDCHSVQYTLAEFVPLSQDLRYPLCAVAAYVILIPLLLKRMEGRKAVDLGSFPFYWNCFLSVFSMAGFAHEGRAGSLGARRGGFDAARAISRAAWVPRRRRGGRAFVTRLISGTIGTARPSSCRSWRPTASTSRPARRRPGGGRRPFASRRVRSSSGLPRRALRRQPRYGAGRHGLFVALFIYSKFFELVDTSVQ